MNIHKTFSSVSRQFVFTVVGLSIFLVGLLSFALYEANVLRFGGESTSEELHSVVEEGTPLAEYLEQEKDFEAHFVTIASLVKQDQQQAVGRTVIFVAIPMILASAALGYLAARYLLKPVKESYESQERFLQDAAHELRNPLAAMSLAIENAKSKSASNLDFVKTMNRQTKRLINVNEDLLYLERRSPDKSIEDIDLSALLYDILEDLQPTISKKSLKVTTNIQDGIIKKMDQTDFIKLTRNILDNAVKYSRSGKKIDISMTKDRDISLTIKDQGIGMSEKDLNRIGERFFRAKNASEFDGSGLGIAIVNKVLNVYGGDMEISSKLNKGTTVKITLKP